MGIFPIPSIEKWSPKWGAGRIYGGGAPAYINREPPSRRRLREDSMTGLWVLTTMFLIRLALPLAATLVLSSALRKALA